MAKKYDEEIAKLTDERQALAGKLSDLMKQRDIQKYLEVCRDEGHVWTLTTVNSDMWEIGNVHLLCTRCSAECITEGGTLGWQKSNIEDLMEMLE